MNQPSNLLGPSTVCQICMCPIGVRHVLLSMPNSSKAVGKKNKPEDLYMPHLRWPSLACTNYIFIIHLLPCNNRMGRPNNTDKSRAFTALLPTYPLPPSNTRCHYHMTTMIMAIVTILSTATKVGDGT